MKHPQSALVCVILFPALASAEVEPTALRQAATRGLKRLEAGAASYIQNRQCFSCHHQTPMIAAFRSAQRRGLPIDEKKLQAQVEFTLETFRSKLERVARGESVPGASTMAAYALFTLELAGHPSDDVTAAVARYLHARQRADGAWPALMNRPPSEGSLFTNNALALRGLKHYGGESEENRQALARGIEWLQKAKPTTMEDRVFQLRALVTAGCEDRAIEAARDQLLREQRSDGSWAQLPDREGDAYATATALLALRETGMAADSPAYRKGLAYLLRTQREDGAWIVETRSRPVQVFFDNGDPGGKSQFISFAATGWAVVALLEALPLAAPASSAR